MLYFQVSFLLVTNEVHLRNMRAIESLTVRIEVFGLSKLLIFEFELLHSPDICCIFEDYCQLVHRQDLLVDQVKAVYHHESIIFEFNHCLDAAVKLVRWY